MVSLIITQPCYSGLPQICSFWFRFSLQLWQYFSLIFRFLALSVNSSFVSSCLPALGEFQTKNVHFHFHSKFLFFPFYSYSEAFSTKKYFGMFALFAFFPLAYALLAGYSGFPLKEQNFDKNALQNESLVVFLELNLTDVQQFSFFVSSGQVCVNVKTINNLKWPFIKRHYLCFYFFDYEI